MERQFEIEVRDVLKSVHERARNLCQGYATGIRIISECRFQKVFNLIIFLEIGN